MLPALLEFLCVILLTSFPGYAGNPKELYWLRSVGVIQRRSKQIVEPELRTIVETLVATMADTPTMSELLQAPTEGYGDAIVNPTILAEDFELKKFDETFSEAWDHFKDLLTFGGNLLNRTPRNALMIIENKLKVRISRNKLIISKVSSTNSSPSPSLNVTALTKIIKELLLMNKATQKAIVKAIEETYVTSGGPHPYYECLYTSGNTFDACAAVETYNQGGNGYRPQGDPNYRVSNQMGPLGFPASNVQSSQNYNPNRQSPSSLGSLPSNTIANPRRDVKAITTRSGISYDGPTIRPTFSPRPKEMKREPEAINDKKLSFPDLTLTRMTLELATRSFPYPAVIAEDVFVQVGKFTFPSDFVVVDYDVDPLVSLILGRPFLRTTRALVDVHRERLILRDDDEQLIFHADSTLKHPHKHGLINMINFIDITCEESFLKVLKLKKSNHPSSGSTTPIFDSFPSLTPFETSDSLLEESIESDVEIIDPILEKFTDEPAINYSPPPGDDDDDDDNLFDLKSDNDEWKNLLYGDCYKDIDFEKDKNKNSKMKSLVIEAHIVKSNDLLPRLLDNDSTLPEESFEIPTLFSSPFENEDKVFNPGIQILGRPQILKDESKDKDLKDKDLILEERNFLSISSKDKNKDFKMKSLVVEAHIVKSNYLLPQLLDNDSTLPEESSEIATLSLSPFENKDKVFNPGIHILGRTQILKDESKDKDLKDKYLILEERIFLSISSYQELMFLLKLTVIETLLSFSSKNEDRLINPRILTSKGVYYLTTELSHQTYKTFKIINIHPNIFNEGIKREFSVPRTPQQNGITERKNRTLIEVARTLLADSLLSIPFWAEAVNTACYVQNRVLVTKPHNKTPYELLHGKVQGKVDEGFLVGYSVCSKAFRVFNSRTHIVQETLHVNFIENKPNVAGSGPTWLFDIDSLTRTMNYHPVIAENQTNSHAGLQDTEKAGDEGTHTYVLFLVLSDGSTNSQNNNKDALVDGKEHDDDIQKSVSPDIHSSSSGAQTWKQGDKTENKDKGKSHVVTITGFRDLNAYTNDFSAAGPSNAAASPTAANSSLQDASTSTHDLDMPNLEDLTHFDDADDVVRILVDLPYGKRAIGTKWVYRNKKDERGIVIRNKARLVAQGHTQEEGIDYDEVFAPVARIEAIRLFLAYASFMGFLVYQMDVKSTFLYSTIEEEVYVCQPPGFEDPKNPNKVYKVVKVLYGLHQAPRAWYETLATYLLENGFQIGTIDQTLFIKKQQKDILLVQIYVDDIIFGATNKALCQSFEKLIKDKFQMSSIGELTFFLGL
nr:retrotransposon protein, putative, unclassified [Tanacetum cinerariifolium]